MNKKIEELTIEGITYVPKDQATIQPVNVDGLSYKIVRTYSAGVFIGYLKSLTGKYAVMHNARRIWYWEGANSLSDLAIIGTTKPDKCKITLPVDIVELTEAIEILSVSSKAFENIAGVPAWTQSK
jgi:hypothetical protein